MSTSPQAMVLPAPESLPGLLQAHGMGGALVERVVLAALAEGELLVVEGVERGVVVMRHATGTGTALVVDTSLVDADRLKALVKERAATGLELCACSNDRAAGKVVKGALPFFTPSAVPVYRVDDTGRVHAVRSLPVTNRPPLLRILTAETRLPEVSSATWAEAVHATRDAAHHRGRQVAEAQDFLGGLQARRSPASAVLLVMMVAVFVLQVVVDLDQEGWSLRRLGALDTARVAAGEWWRVPAMTFLHGSWLHLLFNGLVLWTLGSSIEKLLGSARFLLVYAVSGIVGAAVSAVRLKEGGISVGASGALWGLMAAEAVMVFMPGSPWPELLRARLRQGVTQNLVLNVLNSFRPHVDLAAHLGGGLAGAVFMLLARSTVARAGGQSPATLPRAGSGLPTRAVTSLLCAFYVAGLVTALWHADLPALFQRDVRTRVDVADVGLRVDVPVLASRITGLKPGGPDTSAQVEMGSLKDGPMQFTLQGAVRDPAFTAAQLDEEVAYLRTHMGAGDGTTEVEPVRVETQGEMRTLVAHSTFENGLHFYSVVQLAPGHWARVDMAAFPRSAERAGAEAVLIARSTTPLTR